MSVSGDGRIVDVIVREVLKDTTRGRARIEILTDGEFEDTFILTERAGLRKITDDFSIAVSSTFKDNLREGSIQLNYVAPQSYRFTPKRY